MEKLIISDVRVDSNIAQVTINGLSDTPGSTYKIFKQLSDEKVVVDMILQPAGKKGSVALVFTINQDQADEAVDVLMAHRDALQFETVECKKGMAKVTLSGAGLMSHSDIVPRVLSCFHYSNAPMDMISTSEIAIKVFTDKEKTKRVVEKIRDEFVDYGL